MVGCNFWGGGFRACKGFDKVLVSFLGVKFGHVLFLGFLEIGVILGVYKINVIFWLSVKICVIFMGLSKTNSALLNLWISSSTAFKSSMRSMMC